MSYTLVHIKDSSNVRVLGKIYRTLENYLRRICDTTYMHPSFGVEDSVSIFIQDPEGPCGFSESTIEEALRNSEYGDLMKHVTGIDQVYPTYDD